MKRLLTAIILFVLLLSLFGCSKAPEQKSEEDLLYSKTDLSQFAGMTLKISDVKARSESFYADPEAEDPNESGYISYGATFDYEALSALTGMNLEVSGYTQDDRTMKVLAGDSDVDIYLFLHYDAKKMRDNSICEPISSDIVKDFNAKTFSALQDICVDENGDTVMMPVEYSIMSLFAPKKAVEELNIKPEDIRYWNDFIEYIESYDGDRDCYGASTSLFDVLEQQYHFYHCDLANGAFEYDTPGFRNMYERLLGNWEQDKYGGYAPPYYKSIVEDRKSINQNLFSYSSIVHGIDFSDPEKTQYFCDNFVSFPTPQYDEKVEKNIVSGASFAYINPYSKNKEAALAFLEVVAQNYYDVIGYNCAYMLFADTSMYPNVIDTDSQVFNEFIEMSNDSEIIFFDSGIDVFNVDLSYIYKEITLDEAIAERTRVVNIMLNE